MTRTQSVSRWFPRFALFAAVSITAMAASAVHAVTLAEDGKALGVIVHNGHDQAYEGLSPNFVRRGDIKSPPAELQNYLQQITGAELPDFG